MMLGHCLDTFEARAALGELLKHVTTDQKVVCSNHAGCRSSSGAGWQASTNSSKLKKKGDPPLLRHSSARFTLSRLTGYCLRKKCCFHTLGRG
jgi:hypothetical protein